MLKQGCQNHSHNLKNIHIRKKKFGTHTNTQHIQYKYVNLTFVRVRLGPHSPLAPCERPWLALFQATVLMHDTLQELHHTDLPRLSSLLSFFPDWSASGTFLQTSLPLVPNSEHANFLGNLAGVFFASLDLNRFQKE